MSHAVSVQIGVIVAREEIANAWQDHRWRPVAVIFDAPPIEDWRETERIGSTVLFHAATLPLELHRKETPGYLENFRNDEPAIWIVMRHDAFSSDRHPVTVHAVSASPHDVQAYGETDQESIHSLPMPAPLQALVKDFIARHHVDQPFVKRQRERHHKPAEEKFGQQPIFARETGRPDPPGKGSKND